MKRVGLLFSVALCLIVSGCATTKVERVPVEQQVDLSGSWNDTDAMLVAEDMVKECLGHSWHIAYVLKNNHDPKVIVGRIENQSHEHIDTEVMTKYLERELINSGKVTFVASRDERKQIRMEREDQQQGNTDPTTMAQMGKELGADFMLIGSVHSVRDQIKGKEAVFYQVNFELVNLQTNQKVWLGQKQLKKVVKRSKFSL